MKKTIYISGSISDNQTGLPRKGWQREFMDAETRLMAMGFGVINPIDIAEQTEQEWRDMWSLAGRPELNGPIADAMLQQGPTRATYITACLEAMNTEAMAGRLHGMYVIGSDHDPLSKQRIYHSHGVQMELHMAKVLSLPIFSQFYDGNEIDIHLLPVKDGLRLCEGGEFGKENWSDKL